jgi:hypothetical protein
MSSVCVGANGSGVKGFIRVLAALLVGALLGQSALVAQSGPTAVAATAETTEGAALAAELRAARPIRSFTNSAILHLRAVDGHRTHVPITIRTVVPLKGDEWTVIYRAEPEAGPGHSGGQTLTLKHRAGLPSVFNLTHDGSPAGTVVSTNPDEAFAGSDFSVSDLGLEFFHWPGQRVIHRDRPEMRKGRPCRILESTRPGSTGCVRVRSWIDLEYRQPLMAEAYDIHGTLLKAFSVGSVKKVDGAWQLKDLEIVNESTGTLTRLEFDLKVK